MCLLLTLVFLTTHHLNPFSDLGEFPILCILMSEMSSQCPLWKCQIIILSLACWHPWPADSDSSVPIKTCSPARQSPLWTQVWALFSSPHGESDFFFALTFCYREFQVRMHTPTHTHTHTRKAKQISHVFIAVTNILQFCFFPTWWPFLWNFLKCKSLILCYFTCKYLSILAFVKASVRIITFMTISH